MSDCRLAIIQLCVRLNIICDDLTWFPVALLIDERSETCVYAGSYANVIFANIDLESINVGNVICDVENPISVTTHFEARIVIFNIVLPITIGYTVS